MRILLVLGAYLLFMPSAALAQTAPEELRKAARNPFADEIKLTLEEDFTFNQGPYDRSANSFAIQPVIPLSITGDWLLVTRVVATAIAYQPNSLARSGGATGLGRHYQFFLLRAGQYGKADLGCRARSFNADGYKRSAGSRKMGRGSDRCCAGRAGMGLCRRAGSECLVRCRRLGPFTSKPTSDRADVFLQSASRLVPHEQSHDCCGLDAVAERAMAPAHRRWRGQEFQHPEASG